ncbi:MAG: DUF3566 domain-containing protein [Candidatus Micrarchaeota archaeon]|nr:DUF3566 domain-containing protein [Candidatus Micrarchaeota archaeon]
MDFTIRRISIFSAAKVLALLHAILFFIVGIIYSGVTVIISVISEGEGMSVFGSATTCLTYIIVPPIAGVIYGAVIGLLLGFLYNLIADYTGGLEVGLVEKPPKAPAAPGLQEKGRQM